MISNSNGLPQHRTEKQIELERFKERFQSLTKYGSSLIDYLNRSECNVWRVEQDAVDPRRWWLNIVLPKHVAEMFDAHLEIQVVYAEYNAVEPRLLEIVQSRISKNARVDNGIFVIASLDDTVNRLFRRRSGEFAAIDLNLNQLNRETLEIRHKMAEVLTAADHYDYTKPIHSRSGFFGRDSEFQELISAINSGQSVGVFGLRKTGKTSLLNFVASNRRDAKHPVVWVDISGVSSADEFRLKLLTSAWESAVRSSEVDESRVRLRVLNRSGELKVSPEILRLHWLSDIEKISGLFDKRLEVFIDEIDQLAPGRSYLGAESNELLIVMTQLRGMIQSASPDTGMVLVCAGVDPALFEKSTIGSGADNLLYKLVRLMFLAPLSRDEMAEMVRDLGRRMGIRVRDHETIDFLFAEYGGHALLTRKACSLAARGRDRSHIPWHMSLESVVSAAKESGEDTPYGQAAEIIESFGQWFPQEAEFLRNCWSRDPDDREIALEYFREDHQLLGHAALYGITIKDSCNARIRAVESVVKSGE